MMPGEDVVGFIVQGVVGASRERAFAVPQAQPLPDGFGDAVAGAPDFQRRPVPRVHQHPIERVRPVRNQLPGQRGRDRSVAIEHRRFVGQVQQGEHGDSDQHLGLRDRHIRRIARQGVPVPQDPGGEDVSAELGKGCAARPGPACPGRRRWSGSTLPTPYRPAGKR